MMLYITMISVLTLSGMIGARLAVRFKIHSSHNGVDIAQCAPLALDTAFCGVRVNNDVCEPLTLDWCEAETMSPDDVYLVKDLVIEKLKDPAVSEYVRPLPVFLNEGFELELKISIHHDWATTRMNLIDDAHNVPFHIAFRLYNVIAFNTLINNGWLTELQYQHTLSMDTEYNLKIVCATDGFEVYVDNIYLLFYQHQLPANTAKKFAFYTDTPAHLYQVTYKAGYDTADFFRRR